MSWISGIADKAEQILMKIDENAANKLQKKNKPVRHIDEADMLTEVTTIPSPVPQRRRLSPPATPSKKLPLPQVKSSPSIVNQSQEDKLIDFLNDDSKPAVESVCSKPLTVVQNSDVGDQLEGEKQMLKNEVRVLNNELSLLLHRTRAAEKESENVKTELEDAESSRKDLQEEVNRLVAQVTNLERLNQITVDEKQQQEEQSRSVQSQQVQQLQQQIQTLRDEQLSLNQSLEGARRECVELESSKHSLQQEIDSQNQRLADLRTELDQYRMRAQRTLSDKETLINQLRANNSDASVETSFQTELAQLREERRVMTEEHQQTCEELETLRRRLGEVEHTLDRVRESAARTQQDLQDRLTHDAHKRRIIEDDFRMQGQELQLVREEWSAQRTQLSERLREREAELSHLRSQLTNRPASPTHLLPGELETRLSCLTKTLIQKQTALESASMERNQLRMQLEELEHKHREHLLLLHQSRVISANDTDDAKAQVPSFMMESPFDTGVARRVKRAYSSLDAVSIRTGVFLRRYPLARILVIFYVVLLHMLVMLVLYSRTPDNAQK